MPKSYKQKFRMAWLADPNLKSWLMAEDDHGKCKYCNCIFNSCRLSDLKSHNETRKHKQAVSNAASSQKKIEFPKITMNDNVKLAKVKNALFIAQHCSIMSCDHLVNLSKNIFTDSDIAKSQQMHRTKCSAIIKNVLNEHFIKELKNDIGNSPFSLLIDESTDLSTLKFLGLTIKYYSEKTKDIVSTFLYLKQLKGCDAASIVDAIKETLNLFQLNIKNLRGLGTDNASVMIGINNGVYKQLKEEVPNLVLIRCICHSIQLAVSAASDDALPRNLDFLIK